MTSTPYFTCARTTCRTWSGAIGNLVIPLRREQRHAGFRRVVVQVAVSAGDGDPRPAGHHARTDDVSLVDVVAQIHRHERPGAHVAHRVKPASSVVRAFFSAANACVYGVFLKALMGLYWSARAPRWVWQSIRPGSTVAFDRSIDLRAAGDLHLRRGFDRLDALALHDDHHVFAIAIAGGIEQLARPNVSNRRRRLRGRLLRRALSGFLRLAG